MRYLSEDDARLQGLGYFGDVYEGIDGNLYEWVHGVDAWGGSIGFWQGLSPSTDSDGIGSLYETPDGCLYRVQGLSEDAAPAAEAEAPAAPEQESEAKATPAMGPGRPGQIRVGPDGKRYRWVLGRDAQGKSRGFWRRVRPAFWGPPRPYAHRPGARFRPLRAGYAARRRPPGRRPLLRRILPIARAATALIPGVGPAVATGLTVASRVLGPGRVAGYDGIGQLYEAPDGSLYQVHGMAENDELDGFAENDELDGFAADDELQGFADDELPGISQDDELHGTDQYEQQVGQQDLRGFAQGYVPQEGVGLESYEREEPPETRWFEESAEPPEAWKPLW